ncbi:hypothetical protein GSI_09606 [Ganoderma sinense ZZ0214-1]|uniref:Uncharacterized protein n=1 Tax=Ganoderma sinense ZZ0214-1 TaxID=1077348 RepID=A0A2G8S3L1_9APHY|nr:hypothetical protein GSI_09606 [Ganoderma sinense ZZ0214-1]
MIVDERERLGLAARGIRQAQQDQVVHDGGCLRLGPPTDLAAAMIVADSSPTRGSCWRLQYAQAGQDPVYMIVIAVDNAAAFQLSKPAFDRLAGVEAEGATAKGSVDATAVRISPRPLPPLVRRYQLRLELDWTWSVVVALVALSSAFTV